MSLLQQIFSPRRDTGPANDSGETMPVRMNLEERMAFRRDMMFECIAGVMLHNGIPGSAYRARVVHTDQRGHAFAVMIDLANASLHAGACSPGALNAIGRSIIANAKLSGLIQVVGVYWSIGHEVDGPGSPGFSPDLMPLSET